MQQKNQAKWKVRTYTCELKDENHTIIKTEFKNGLGILLANVEMETLALQISRKIGLFS